MKKYHKDYVLETEIGKGGKEEKRYRYAGDYYLFPGAEAEKKKIFIKNFIFVLLYFLLIITAGLLDNEGSRNFFIAVPYAFLFLPGVYLSLGTAASLKLDEKMQRSVYDKALGRMYRSCIGIMVISLYLCIADSILIFLNIGGKNDFLIVREVVFLFDNIAIFCLSFIQKKYLQNLKKRVMIGKYNNEVP